MNALNILNEVTRTLKAGGVESAQEEAVILVTHALDIDTLEIYRDNPEFGEDQRMAVKEMTNRRLMHEPLQYILGCVEFLGLELIIGPGVLIPRPETELLAQHAIKQFTVHSSQLTVLDIGTGSGCLALALAKEFPQAEVYGTDISEVALRYAKESARLNCINNVTFLKGNLFEPIEKRFTVHGLRFAADLIISNPPYIKTETIEALEPQIRDWEPIEALDGGVDGLDVYRRLIPKARQFLEDSAILMLEVGEGQSHDVRQMLESSGYSDIEIIKDYAGIDRIIQARWRR